MLWDGDEAGGACAGLWSALRPHPFSAPQIFHFQILLLLEHKGSGTRAPVLLQSNSKSQHHTVHLRVEYKTAIAAVNIEPAGRQKQRVFFFEFLPHPGIDLPRHLRASPEPAYVAFQSRKPAFFQIEPEARAQHRI